MTGFKWAMALLTAALVCGCTALHEHVDQAVSDGAEQAEHLKQAAGHPTPSASAAAVVERRKGVWIGNSTVRLDPYDQLPPIFREPATFDRTVASLSEFAERITLRTGLSVQVTVDAMGAAMRTLHEDNTDSPGALGQTQVVGAPQQRLRGRVAQIHIAYTGGNLRGLLDAASARFGVYWRPVEGGVQFYYVDTRAFQILAIPGDASLSASVGSSSNSSGEDNTSGGSNRSNTQNTEVSTRLSVFASIEKSIAAMLSPYGKVTASPATGSISVTDTPDALKRIASFVEDENRSLSKQVMINVTVLAVSTTNLSDYGINWDVVYNNLQRRFGISNTYTAEPGSASFSAAILNTSGSRLAGSSMLVNALATQGKVRRETSASVATLNNQPVPVQVATQTSYLKSSSTSLTANVGTTTTLEPGTVTSGFNMTILPHVLSNGTVMLQFGTDISELKGIRTVSSNGTTIETPEVDTRNFLQRVAMKSGDTLVISGFEQTDDNINRQGVGDPRFFALGGGTKATSGKEVIVIVITPITMAGA